MGILGFLFFLLVLYMLWHVCLMFVGVAAFVVAFAVFILMIIIGIAGAF